MLSNTKVYGHVKTCIPLSLTTENALFYTRKFGQRIEVTL
jgi:hypothetical protein